MSTEAIKTDKNALKVPRFYSIRSVRQYVQSWYANLFYPKCNDLFVQRIRNRIKLGGWVTSTCRCGACKLICEDAPRIVSVCHCSICRFDEARAIGAENAPAPSFAAVKRSVCRMDGTCLDGKTLCGMDRSWLCGMDGPCLVVKTCVWSGQPIP